MPEISQEELDQLKASVKERDTLKSEMDKLKSAKPKEEPNPEDDKDKGLLDKAAKEREDSDAKKSETKRIESALSFNISLTDFMKTHADILPSEMAEILKVSDKEKYDSALDKAAAVKTAFVQSFFSVQANVDLLTASQKSKLEDYLKLTKNGKEAKAEDIYENLFEPALETLKRVKKADELNKARSGLGNPSKVDDAYKARLISTSKKTYLGEKGA